MTKIKAFVSNFETTVLVTETIVHLPTQNLRRQHRRSNLPHAHSHRRLREEKVKVEEKERKAKTINRFVASTFA